MSKLYRPESPDPPLPTAFLTFTWDINHHSVGLLQSLLVNIFSSDDTSPRELIVIVSVVLTAGNKSPFRLQLR